MRAGFSRLISRRWRLALSPRLPPFDPRQAVRRAPERVIDAAPAAATISGWAVKAVIIVDMP